MGLVKIHRVFRQDSISAIKNRSSSLDSWVDTIYVEDRTSMRKYSPYIIPVIIIIGLGFFCKNPLLAYFSIHSAAYNAVPSGSSVNSGLSSNIQNPTPARHEDNALPTAPVNTQQCAGSVISILMYHQIGDGPNDLYVTTDNFRAQMNYLHESGYHTVTMAEANEMLANNKIPAKTVVLTFDDGYKSFITQAWPIMRDLGFTGTVFVCTSLVGQYNYLTWDEIKDLHEEGIEIGSHTRNHIDLKKASYQQQIQEIQGSKKVLDETLGVPCLSFCYPSGAYGDVTPTIVQDSGYTSAVTVAFGYANPNKNAYQLPRVRVRGRFSLNEFVQNIPKT